MFWTWQYINFNIYDSCFHSFISAFGQPSSQPSSQVSKAATILNEFSRSRQIQYAFLLSILSPVLNRLVLMTCISIEMDQCKPTFILVVSSSSVGTKIQLSLLRYNYFIIIKYIIGEISLHGILILNIFKSLKSLCFPFNHPDLHPPVHLQVQLPYLFQCLSILSDTWTTFHKIQQPVFWITITLHTTQ